jgi:hypothetical protein
MRNLTNVYPAADNYTGAELHRGSTATCDATTKSLLHFFLASSANC